MARRRRSGSWAEERFSLGLRRRRGRGWRGIAGAGGGALTDDERRAARRPNSLTGLKPQEPWSNWASSWPSAPETSDRTQARSLNQIPVGAQCCGPAGGGATPPHRRCRHRSVRSNFQERRSMFKIHGQRCRCLCREISKGLTDATRVRDRVQWHDNTSPLLCCERNILTFESAETHQPGEFYSTTALMKKTVTTSTAS